MPSLMSRRLQDISRLLYKAKNNLSPTYLNDLFKMNDCMYNLRVKEFYVPRFETVTFGKNSLKYLGPTVWSNILTGSNRCRNAFKNIEIKLSGLNKPDKIQMLVY